jgi:biopolymer transport protein ExbD
MSKEEAIPEGINDLPDPSTFAAPEDAYGKSRKRREIDDGMSLNINSLMDIMTIILVFLLKSYSTNPVQLKPAPDLKPPFSISQLDPTESTTLTITLNNILVDDKKALDVDNGVVAESDREGGGFMINPLFEALQAAVDHQKRVAKFNSTAEFKGIVTIISDRHVPFDLLSQCMYTAGQASFSKFKFMVVKKGV